MYTYAKSANRFQWIIVHRKHQADEWDKKFASGRATIVCV